VLVPEGAGLDVSGAATVGVVMLAGVCAPSGAVTPDSVGEDDPAPPQATSADRHAPTTASRIFEITDIASIPIHRQSALSWLCHRFEGRLRRGIAH
jgi:hypothetical protein